MSFNIVKVWEYPHVEKNTARVVISWDFAGPATTPTTGWPEGGYTFKWLSARVGRPEVVPPVPGQDVLEVSWPSAREDLGKSSTVVSIAEYNILDPWGTQTRGYTMMIPFGAQPVPEPKKEEPKPEPKPRPDPNTELAITRLVIKRAIQHMQEALAELDPLYVPTVIK